MPEKRKGKDRLPIGQTLGRVVPNLQALFFGTHTREQAFSTIRHSGHTAWYGTNVIHPPEFCKKIWKLAMTQQIVTVIRRFNFWVAQTHKCR